MRYPLTASSSGSAGPLLEMWAYEASRLFRDRLVGGKAQQEFDNILTSVVRSDWSLDIAYLQHEGGPSYVTWGASQKGRGLFGRPLGRLSSSDTEKVVTKGVMAYGELVAQLPA